MALAQALARRRIYYGWYIVGLVFITNLVFSGPGNAAPAMFLKPMTQELEWSRMFFATAVSLGMVTVSPLSLFVGPLVDRQGARLPMLAGGFLLGAGLIALGFVHTQWQFLLVRGLLVPLGIAALAQVSGAVAVANWFVKKRGRAMAISTMGMSTGWFMITPLAAYLIGALGWRHAWIVLGLLTWALVLPPIGLLMRRRPEDFGLLPDGEPAGPQAGAARPSPRPEITWNRREAMRTPTLWLLTFAVPLGMIGMGAVNIHFYSYLTDLKITPQTATLITTSIYVAAFMVKPPLGFIAERVPARYCLAAAFASMGTAMALLALASPSMAVFVLAAVFGGMGWGSVPPLQGLIWANYFGRLSQGRVQSLAIPISAMLNPLGPILAGRVYDVTGSYERIFLIYISTQAVAVFLALMALPPKKRAPPTLAEAKI